MSVHGSCQPQSWEFRQCPLPCRPLHKQPALLNLRLCEEAWLASIVAAVQYLKNENCSNTILFQNCQTNRVSSVFISGFSFALACLAASHSQILTFRFVPYSAEHSHFSIGIRGTIKRTACV